MNVKMHDWEKKIQSQIYFNFSFRNYVISLGGSGQIYGEKGPVQFNNAGKVLVKSLAPSAVRLEMGME
jgi:hypothetical protein